LITSINLRQNACHRQKENIFNRMKAEADRDPPAVFHFEKKLLGPDDFDS
jgi:hypothetical protein